MASRPAHGSGGLGSSFRAAPARSKRSPAASLIVAVMASMPPDYVARLREAISWNLVMSKLMIAAAEARRAGDPATQRGSSV